MVCYMMLVYVFLMSKIIVYQVYRNLKRNIGLFYNKYYVVCFQFIEKNIMFLVMFYIYGGFNRVGMGVMFFGDLLVVYG